MKLLVGKEVSLNELVVHAGTYVVFIEQPTWHVGQPSILMKKFESQSKHAFIELLPRFHLPIFFLFHSNFCR